MQREQRKDGITIVHDDDGITYAIDRSGNMLPCNYYGGKWHVPRYAREMMNASRLASQIEERLAEGGLRKPRFSYRPRHRPDAQAVRRIAASLGPNVPREELPEELDASMCAGLAGVGARHIRRLCAAGEWVGAYREEQHRAWRVPTDTFLAWLEARGLRYENSSEM